MVAQTFKFQVYGATRDRVELLISQITTDFFNLELVAFASGKSDHRFDRHTGFATRRSKLLPQAFVVL